MGIKCAKFCGKFEDKHAESEDKMMNPDDEAGDEKEGGMMPKDYDRIKKELLKPQGLTQKITAKLNPAKASKHSGLMTGSDAMAVKAWLKHQTTVPVEESIKGGGSLHRYADAIVVNGEKLKPVMLKKLRTFQTLHTIELIQCNLKDLPPALTDIESLRVLRLSRNQIKCVRKEMTRNPQGKYSSLQRILLDENAIEQIELGTFCTEAAQEFVIINLGKNLLPMLPIDFCMRAMNLEILDLSFNKLQSLPDSIMECSALRILDVCNNQLKSLPDSIDKLKKMRKLFANTNQLTELPETIGKCESLEKLWVSDNLLKYLPYSTIDLWYWPPTFLIPGTDEPGGCLEEIMVDDNPLIVPSVTAFQMGGPNQMFRLFKETKDEEDRARKKGELEALALMNAPDKQDRQPALRDVAALDADATVDIDEGHALVPRANIDTTASAHGEGAGGENDGYGDIPADEGAAEDAPDEVIPTTSKKKGPDYYFEFCKDDYDVQSRIRSAESSLMLLKRQIYVDQIKDLARKRAEEAKKSSNMTEKERAAKLEKFKKYTDDDIFNVQSFKGAVHVSDLDLFFTLLVITAKPLGATCFQLYNKFNDPTTDTMARKNWDYFCARVPVKLPDEIKTSMWKVITFRSAEKDTAVVTAEDFTACMHIHDIALQDPFVARCAQVLKLKYYSMPMAEFENKIRRRGNDTANALESVDFPSDDDEPAEKGSVEAEGPNEDATGEGQLTAVEGERQLAHSNQEAVAKVHHSKAKEEGKGRRPMISMTEAQYCQVHTADDAEQDEEVQPTGYELSSTELSMSDASDSSFDAEDCMDRLEELEAEKVETAQKEVPKQKFQIKNPDDLSQLMSLPARDILGAPQERVGVERDAAKDAAIAKKNKIAKDKEKKRQKQSQGATMVRDPRFGTNMMTVRRAIRDAYRNLPFDDFVALINFLLRGLKHIKHYDATVHITYWHADDPVIRHLMGVHDTNKYPAAILREMGFVCVFGIYWVWPDKHMKNLGEKARNRLVPTHCPGTEKMRLDDLIKLIDHCRKSLEKAGRRFTGHCRAS